MTPAYRDGTVGDAAAIRAVYVESFDGVFRDQYSDADYDAFMAGQGVEVFAAQLADPAYDFRLAEVGGALVGYCKLGPPSLPFDAGGRRAHELRQLYLLDAAKGGGVAATLMDWALATARARGAQDLWLSVWTDNPRARAFYRRYGFDEVTPYRFMVGNHADEDILCRLRLE